jgi:hypothetical protein
MIFTSGKISRRARMVFVPSMCGIIISVRTARIFSLLSVYSATASDPSFARST